MTSTEVEVTHRPRVMTFVDVPEELKAHFAAQDYRLSWQKHGTDSESLLFGLGIRPITISEIQADNPKLAEKLKDQFVDSEGRFRKMDCVLCKQSEANRDEINAHFDTIRTAREDGGMDVELLEAALQESVRATGRSSGGPLLVGRIPTASEAVQAAKTLKGAPNVQVGLEP